MTIKQGSETWRPEILLLRTFKRRLVKEFKAGERIDGLALLVWNEVCMRQRIDLTDCRIAAEQVLRDFMLGKFHLTPKAKR